ncbi:MAG TPA: terminase small subunit [Gemmata sp.]
MALTAQQELFCKELIACKFNATEAYRRAYPKAKPTSVQPSASRLLSNVMVQVRVSELFQQVAANEGITPERVLRELGFIAFQRGSQIRRPDGTLKSPSEWDEATDATIAGVEIEEELVPDADAEESREPQGHGGALKRSKVKVKVVRTTKVKRWDKVQALKLFTEHFGLLKEAAPHPDRPKIDLTNLSEDQKRALLDLFRAARGS